MVNNRHVRSLRDNITHTVMPLPARQQRHEVEYRAFLQEHIDTAQGGMFQALEKRQRAMQLLREADFEKEIHGKALTAAQMRRAELANGQAQGDQLDLGITSSNRAYNALPAPTPNNRGQLSITAKSQNKPVKAKSGRSKVVAIARPARLKNIWGQTAWP